MKLQGYTFLFLFFAVCLITHQAFAWDFKKYEASSEEPQTASFCALKKDYEEGISMTFSKDTQGQMVLFFAFRDLKFAEGSAHLFSVIFKDAKEQLQPKIFRTEGKAIKSDLVKSATFGKEVVLDMLGLYSNVEVIVDNKVFNIPLGKEWMPAVQQLKRCATEIHLPVMPQQSEILSSQAQTSIQPSIEPMVEPVIESLPAQENPLLRKVLSLSGLSSFDIEPLSPTVARWQGRGANGEGMKGIFQEYSLEKQEGHASEKLRMIAENTVFTLRRLCGGAFVSDISRIEHIKDQSFIRADGACSGDKVDTTTAILFMEQKGQAYVFIQESALERAASVIEFRNNLMKIIKDL